MFTLTSSNTYYLYQEACDMRKSFDALSGLVTNNLGKNPCSGEVFIFISKDKGSIKLLQWEKDGFVIYYKRLEKGTFTPPENAINGVIQWPALIYMILGLRAEKIRQKPRFSTKSCG